MRSLVLYRRVTHSYMNRGGTLMLRMTSSHSKFDRNGVIMPSANSALKSMPLCGDLMFFRKFTLLQFSGHVDRGLIMVSISLA